MTDFLSDKVFLQKINRFHYREYYAAITILDFETEKPLTRIEGKVISGNMNIAADSVTRRTGSLTIVFDNATKNITETSNLIAIDKKVSISIGINNPFFYTSEYVKYGEQLWFKQGVFIITQATSSITTSSAQISINFIDKMGYLNGTCGGTLPASTSFHESIVIDENENTTIEYPIISQIIKEVVHHFGGEHYSRISVEDVPETGRIVVAWNASTPINFATDDSFSPPIRLPGGSFVIQSPPVPGFSDSYYKGDVVGYKETPLTYPGELTFNGGATVTQVLDQIVSTLGNYEYFYDVDGIFHFRQKNNFLKTGNTPLNLTEREDSDLQALYMPIYNNDMYLNEFADNELITQISFNPNYSNIKNDFICWGTRQNNSNTEVMVRYHLAIDERPKDIRRPKADGSQEENEYALYIGSNYSLCHKDIYVVKDTTHDTIIRYQSGDALVNEPYEKAELIAPALDDAFPELDESYWFNWREELYRKALLAHGTSTEGSYYDEELMAEWRNIFDPMSTIAEKGVDSFEQGWTDHYGDGSVPWYGYTINVITAPDKLRYWLDLIDTSSALGKYSVNRIGRRTKVTENSKINEVFAKEINDIVFITNNSSESEQAAEALRERMLYYISIGQTYCLITQDQEQYFTQRNSFGTCYEEVRDMLYNSIIYNSSVSLTTIPIFYLDVNYIVHLNQGSLGIKGNFIINKISWNLGNTQTMQLSLQEAISIV